MKKRANKGKVIAVRFTEPEYKHIREIVKVNTGTMSEFVRTCVNAQLAQVGDPEGMELLTAVFEKGMQEMVQRRVREEIAKHKK